MNAKKPQAKTPAKSQASADTNTNLKALSPDEMSAADADARILGTVPNIIPEVRKIFNDTMNAVRYLQDVMPGNQDLTPLQRRRLLGVRARKLGFITKAMEIADARPNFVPPGLSMPNMTVLRNNLEETRQLLAVVDQLRRFLDDYMLTGNDALYRAALGIYGQLQTLARMRVPGAQDLFNILRQFFINRRRPGEAEPTEHELEREFHSLLHGHADGEMVIKNESPHKTGGVHEVVENVSKRGKRKAEIKVKEE